MAKLAALMIFSCLFLLVKFILTHPTFKEDTDLKVWRVVSVSDYYSGYVKEEMHVRLVLFLLFSPNARTDFALL